MAHEDGTPLLSKIMPSRQAAKRALVNFSEQLGSSPDQSEDEKSSKARGKNRAKVTYGRKQKKNTSPSKGASTSMRQLEQVSPTLRQQKPASTSIPVFVSLPRPRPTFAGKKRRLTPSEPSLSADEDSDIVILDRPPTPNPSTPSQTQSTTSTTSPFARPFSSISRSRSLIELAASQIRNELDSWNIKSLGTYVWVLIDRHARVFEPEDEADEENSARENLWWPGKIKSVEITDIPLAVTTFGTVSHGIGSSIEIQTPCARNILPMTNSLGRVRFDAPEFAHALSTQSLEASPRKKQKHDREELENRWHLAVSEMVREKEDDEDGLPDVGLAYSVGSLFASSPAGGAKGNGNRNGQTKGAGGKDIGRGYRSDDGLEIDTNKQRWTPPPQDDSLRIPGELVLARDNCGRYWPGQVLEYIPPTIRYRRAGKYRILFLDETQAILPRSSFYSAEEDGFGTCTLGLFKSCYRDVVNDKSDGEDSADEGDVARFPSPVPIYPPPNPFVSLDIPQQFAYTKNILQAVLCEKYEPAKRKHDMFIGGGHSRKQVVDEAGLRGKMDPKDVAKLEKCLTRWCLREETRAEKVVDDPEDQELTTGELPIKLDEEHNDGSPKHDDRPSPSPTTEHDPFVSPHNTPPSSSLSTIGDSAPIDVDLASPPPPLPALSETSSEIAIMVRSPKQNLSNSSEKVVGGDTDADENGNTQRAADNNASPIRPRQMGCPAYEALSGVEKVDYCLNILLPEAILQILLWRSGERTSVELLSEDEEQTLHDAGEEKLRETDWVFDVMRLRQSKVRQLERRAGGSRSLGGAENATNGGTMSRPRKSAGARRY